MNIEEIFKSSLEDSEMPFDPKAWESMSARLDQAMPVSAPKSSWKWGWVAAVAVVAGLSAFFFIQKETKNPAKKQVVVAKPEVDAKESEASPVENEEHSNVENSSNAGAAPTEKNHPKEVSNPFLPNETPRKSDGHGATGSGHSFGLGTTPITEKKATAEKGDKPFIFVAPIVDASYCEGEKVSIKNTNDYAIQLLGERGNAIELAANKTTAVEISDAGSYQFVYGKNGKSETAFKVQSKPKADFFANEETLYDHGLPVNTLKSTYSAQEYIWTNAKGEILSRKQETEIHLFTKGEHDITLKVVGSNGCTSQTTKSVRCESNYNLLAMSGFNPESSSIKNRTFIPYALLERNVSFEMEIIDPKTGQVIYATKNADEPWDGTNRLTNQMIPEGATYIWRVKIDKKEVGEPKSVYQGSITRM